ncbi:MAG: hypothetical protein BGO95_10955 [Micrococcales bacterium 73-13]|nr:MAG: hypothetical protein BGO95_10955 [Micrococcales bacterium 73-13]
MVLTPAQSAFVESHGAAAMITVGPDGVPKPVRIAYRIVDGRIWSSGTATRVRTRHLRQDPRATLFIWDPVFDFLSVHTTVTILDGPDAADLNLRYFRLLQGRPEGPLSWMGSGEHDEEAFRELLIADQRLIYEFEPTGAFGSLRD